MKNFKYLKTAHSRIQGIRDILSTWITWGVIKIKWIKMKTFLKNGTAFLDEMLYKNIISKNLAHDKNSFIIASLLCHWPSYRFSQSFLCQPSFLDVFVFCACAVGLAPGRVGSVEAYGSAGRPPQASGLVGCLVLTLCVPGPLADYTPHTADGINTHTRYNSNPMVSGVGGTRTPSLAKTRLQTQCLVTQPCETTLPVS